jgi:hypothetical protein
MYKKTKNPEDLDFHHLPTSHLQSLQDPPYQLPKSNLTKKTFTMKFSASLLVAFGFIATTLANPTLDTRASKKGKHGGGSDDNSNVSGTSFFPLLCF